MDSIFHYPFGSILTKNVSYCKQIKEKQQNLKSNEKEKSVKKLNFTKEDSNKNSKSKFIEDMKNKSSKVAKILTTTSFSDLIQVNKWWEMQVEDLDSET